MRPRAADGVGGGSPDHSPRRLGLDRRALRHSADCATRCRHANSLAFTLGGITLASFVLLVITGIYLAQYYDPTQAKAHGSVVYITDNAFAGALIRSLHYWLSTAFVVALVLHTIRTFATASFKAPREGIWITGVVLFLRSARLRSATSEGFAGSGVG